jgi:hypothetical protein
MFSIVQEKVSGCQHRVCAVSNIAANYGLARWPSDGANDSTDNPSSLVPVACGVAGYLHADRMLQQEGIDPLQRYVRQIEMAKTNKPKAETSTKPIPNIPALKPPEKPAKQLTPKEQADFDKRYEELKKKSQERA